MICMLFFPHHILTTPFVYLLNRVYTVYCILTLSECRSYLIDVPYFVMPIVLNYKIQIEIEIDDNNESFDFECESNDSENKFLAFLFYFQIQHKRHTTCL